MAGSESKEAINFDPNDLTVGEIEDLEEVSGKTLGQIGSDLQNENLTGKVIKAIVWIVQRRKQPDLTLEQVRDIKIGVLFGTNGSKPK